MRDPTSPWNVKVKKNTNYNIQESLEPCQETEKKLPSLFLDALGGGKPKIASHKTSVAFKEVESVEDDKPPLNSIYSLNFKSISYSNAVTLIGYPPSKEAKVIEIAEKIDQILEIKKSGQNGNWMVVTFASFRAVEKMLEYDGKLIDDSWVLTVKVGELFSSGTGIVTESLDQKTTRASKPSPLKFTKRVGGESDINTQETFTARENAGINRKEPMVASEEEPLTRAERDVGVSNVNVDFPDEIFRPSYWNHFKDIVFSCKFAFSEKKMPRAGFKFAIRTSADYKDSFNNHPQF